MSKAHLDPLLSFERLNTLCFAFQASSSLVTITSEAENKFVLELVQDTSATTPDIWLGAFRAKGGKMSFLLFFILSAIFFSAYSVMFTKGSSTGCDCS